MSDAALPAPAHAARTPLRAVARWKLTEPVRLYLWSVGVVLVAGLNLAGVLTGEWPHYAASSLAVVLGLVPATAAARASAYSPVGTVQACREAARRAVTGD